MVKKSPIIAYTERILTMSSEHILELGEFIINQSIDEEMAKEYQQAKDEDRLYYLVCERFEYGLEESDLIRKGSKIRGVRISEVTEKKIAKTEIKTILKKGFVPERIISVGSFDGEHRLLIVFTNPEKAEEYRRKMFDEKVSNKELDKYKKKNVYRYVYLFRVKFGKLEKFRKSLECWMK